MNRDQLEGKQQKPGKDNRAGRRRADDYRLTVEGRRDVLAATLREYYGMTREAVNRHLQEVGVI
jgi:hypothetical protein